MKTSRKFTDEYIITSRELIEKLNLEGDIEWIGLFEGRSPNEIAKGVSAEKDKWTIRTTRTIKVD